MFKFTLTLIALAAVMASGTAFGQSNDLAELLMDADEEQFALIFPSGVELPKLTEKIERALPILMAEIDRKLQPDETDDAKERLAKRQANAAVVLLRMKQTEKVWPLLMHSPDPRVRSCLIHLLKPLGVDATTIIKRLDDEPDISIRRALLLSLGEFDVKELSTEDRKAFLPKLQLIYGTDDDPGLHAASEWLLRQWKFEDWLKRVNADWAKDKEQRDKRLDGILQLLSKDKEKTPSQWYVNGQGQTMVVIQAPVEFVMGSPPTEAGREDDEQQHKVRIGQSFSISSKVVTVEQFLRFRKYPAYIKQFSPTDDCPTNFVTWYEAVEYCNWLCEQEGIPRNQWCYEPNTDGQYAEGMRMAPNYLQRTGYRLPTEPEWEYACRAGTVTGYSFGESEELLAKYAWFRANSAEMSHPVGFLKPNDFGLFDMHGNSWQWCQDAHRVNVEPAEELAVNDEYPRVLRGGSFNRRSSLVRSANRYGNQPTTRYVNVDFRLARTLPPYPLTALPLSPNGNTIEKTGN